MKKDSQGTAVNKLTEGELLEASGDNLPSRPIWKQ